MEGAYYLFFKKSIILPITLLVVLLSNSIYLSSFGEVVGSPKPTDPGYYIWYQHYFQGNADGMNNNTKPGPHDKTYNKGWKDGYQSVYGVYVPVPHGKSTNYVKGYRIGYTNGKQLSSIGDDTDTSEIPGICHDYSADWCHGWQDGYKLGWNDEHTQLSLTPLYKQGFKDGCADQKAGPLQLAHHSQGTPRYRNVQTNMEWQIGYSDGTNACR
jgi:hypothetical protein